MKIRMGRLCTYALMSLLSLFAFAAQVDAQNYTFSRLGGSPKLRGETENTHQAESADAAEIHGFRILHSFCPSEETCTDGLSPVAGLIEDAAGILYGTTQYGGANSPVGSYGYGTVFKVDSKTHQEAVLYSFCSEPNCTDGEGPLAGLIEDAAGNLYGTTAEGGAIDLCIKNAIQS